MSTLRVAYASFDRFPSPKGAATHIDAFARALGTAFGAVDLITVAPSAEWPGVPQRHAPGVRHHALQVPGNTLIHRVFAYRRQLLGLLPKLCPDVTHFRSIFEGFPVAQQKRRLCGAIIYEVNGLPSIELKYHYPDVADDPQLLAKLRYQEQACLAAADAVVTISEVTAEHLAHRGVSPERIHVIPNGVDTELFSFQPPQPWRASGPRLLYSGTMSPWQGVLTAVEALALIRRDAPARLTLVGDARPRQLRDIERRCEKLGVSEFVEIHPPVSRRKLARMHHSADVILAPLKSNDRNRVQGCCPLKVLEAMASGTPLIASDLAVVRALARAGEEAWLVRPGSAKAIKDAVFRIRSDPHTARRMAAAGRRRVLQHFRWSHANAKLLAVYETLREKLAKSAPRAARS